MLQLGSTTETEFDGPVTQKYDPGTSYHTAMKVELNLNPELKKINRKTDGFFDWLGDWGGLQDGLTLLVDIVVNLN